VDAHTADAHLCRDLVGAQTLRTELVHFCPVDDGFAPMIDIRAALFGFFKPFELPLVEYVSQLLQ